MENLDWVKNMNLDPEAIVYSFHATDLLSMPNVDFKEIAKLDFNIQVLFN